MITNKLNEIYLKNAVDDLTKLLNNYKIWKCNTDAGVYIQSTLLFA